MYRLFRDATRYVNGTHVKVFYFSQNLYWKFITVMDFSSYVSIYCMNSNALRCFNNYTVVLCCANVFSVYLYGVR